MLRERRTIKKPAVYNYWVPNQKKIKKEATKPIYQGRAQYSVIPAVDKLPKSPKSYLLCGVLFEFKTLNLPLQ